MAINTDSLLHKLSPMQGIDFSPITQMRDREAQKSAERQRLELARQQFEFQKKQAIEDKELRALEERGRNARQQMQAEEERAKAEAVKEAALLAEQQKQLAEFGKLAGTGQVQQADAMSPLLDQLGYNLNNLGGVGGLPVYQLENRAQEAARASQEFEQKPRAIDSLDGEQSLTQSLNAMGEAGLGYPTNERGTLEDTQASKSTLPDDPSMQSFGGEDPVLDEATADALMPGDGDYRYTPSPYAPDGGGAYGSMEEGAGHDMPEEEPAEVVVNAGGSLGVAQLSGQDPFARALAAGRQGRETGMPTRAPDEEDYMGAVPRNVIDLPAMNAQTQARLNPMLKSMTGALPDELQPGAEEAARAAAGLGLEAKDALAEYTKATAPALDIYKNKQSIEAQKAKDERLDPVQIAGLQTVGENRAAKLADERGVSNILSAVKSAQVALDVLDDKDPNNDTMIAPALMEAQGVKGVPSNTDLAYSLGMKNASTITQIVAFIEEKLIGGMSTDQKTAIKNYLKAVQESQKSTVNGFLDSAYDRVDRGDMDPHVKDGYLGKIEQSIPAWMYNDYHTGREKSGKGRGRASQSAPVDAGDLDSEKLGRVIGHESKGDATATSVAGASGTMQIMPENLRAMGIEPEEFKKLSPAEQMPYNIRYLKGHGITKDSSPEDYAMAVAAPAFIGKPPGTVVYPKSDDPKSPWMQNPGWRPADGGDITNDSILAFYGLGAGKGEKKAEAAPAKSTEFKMPEPKTPQEKRYLELLAKRKGG